MSETVSFSYPALSRSTKVSEESAYLVPEYNLPGFGNQTSQKCNVANFVEYCPDCHHTDVHHYHCCKWECPICYPWTASKRARESANRLCGVYEAWKNHGVDLGYINQIVISVPESEYADFDEKKYAKRMRKEAKKIGLSGGLAVFHPYRVLDEIEEVLRIVMQEKGIEGGNWVGIHQNILRFGYLNGRLIDTWLDYVEFAPHWHIIGFFKLKEKSDAFYERTGWTYKNVSMEKYHEPLNKDGVRGTLRYLCTHHRIEKGKQSVTYFGKAAPNQVLHETIVERKVAKCPQCSAEYQEMDLEGKVTCIITKGDLYKIPVRGEREADEIIEDIRLRRFKFDPKLYEKAWYPVVHHFYSVRTEFNKKSKPAKIVDDSRLHERSCLPPIPEATEEEKEWYRAYRASLPSYEDAPYFIRQRGGSNAC